RNGQMIDEINLRVERNELVSVERERSTKPNEEPQHSANNADDNSLCKEHSANRFRRKSHRFEYSDLTRFVCDYHRQCADNIERRHNHDQQQNHAHSQLLELERLEQRMVLLFPID